MSSPKAPGRRGPKRSGRIRKPNAERFFALRLHLPVSATPLSKGANIAVAALIASGICIGAFWPQQGKANQVKDEIFVMEEEIPPPDPAPPPPKLEPPPEPPPPQFGMDDDALSETGDLAVATGNTIMKEADSVVAPAPPPLPPSPVMVDQAPRILSGTSPVYPGRAQDKGLEATVVALITIDTLGRVTQVQIEKSGGHEFDDAVLKSARATLFQPPIRNGRKISARFRAPFEFKLEE